MLLSQFTRNTIYKRNATEVLFRRCVHPYERYSNFAITFLSLSLSLSPSVVVRAPRTLSLLIDAHIKERQDGEETERLAVTGASLFIAFRNRCVVVVVESIRPTGVTDQTSSGPSLCSTAV